MAAGPTVQQGKRRHALDDVDIRLADRLFQVEPYLSRRFPLDACVREGNPESGGIAGLRSVPHRTRQFPAQLRWHCRTSSRPCRPAPGASSLGMAAEGETPVSFSDEVRPGGRPAASVAATDRQRA